MLEHIVLNLPCSNKEQLQRAMKPHGISGQSVVSAFMADVQLYCGQHRSLLGSPGKAFWAK